MACRRDDLRKPEICAHTAEQLRTDTGMAKAKNPQLLKEHLSQLTVDELRRLNGFFPNTQASRKEERINAIEQSMMQGDGLTQLWSRLDQLQKAAVSEVVHNESNLFDPDRFRAKYGGDPNFGTAQWRRITDPSILSLFFYRNEMPTDVKAALKSIVPMPTAARIKTVDSLPEQVPLTLFAWQHNRGYKRKMVDLTRCDTQQIAQHDLLAMLQLVEAGQVKVTAKTQRPTSATLFTIAEVLEGGDYYPKSLSELGSKIIDGADPAFMRPFAWPMLLLNANLVEVAGAKLQLTASGKQAKTAPLHETLRKIWKSWLKNKNFDEFNRITAIKGQTRQGADSMTAPAPRRQKIAETLSVLPINQWVEFDEFSRFMQASGQTFTISRDLWTLYIEDANYGSLGYQGFGDWHIVQARYLLVFLMEYAATLGLIDIAYVPPNSARLDFGNLWGVDDFDYLSNYDGLRYLRLNNFGAWCLGINHHYQPLMTQQEKLFNVLPNHDIVIPGTFTASDRLMLSRIAEQTSERVWHLDTAKLIEAHEASLTFSEIRKYLATKSLNDLPQTVTRLLEELSEKSARLVKLEGAHLIEVTDRQTMQLLANDSRLSKVCLPAGERHLVIPAQSLNAFRRILHEMGYTLPLSAS